MTNLLAALTLVYAFSSNLTTVSGFTIPELVAPVGLALSLDQGWSVFAPGVTRYNDWYVIPGTLRSVQQVNLIPAALHNDFNSREEVSWKKPPDVSGDLKNKYWRKHLRACFAEVSLDGIVRRRSGGISSRRRFSDGRPQIALLGQGRELR